MRPTRVWLATQTAFAASKADALFRPADVDNYVERSAP